MNLVHDIKNLALGVKGRLPVTECDPCHHDLTLLLVHGLWNRVLEKPGWTSDRESPNRVTRQGLDQLTEPLRRQFSNASCQILPLKRVKRSWLQLSSSLVATDARSR
jgi:hypothetical protein